VGRDARRDAMRQVEAEIAGDGEAEAEGKAAMAEASGGRAAGVCLAGEVGEWRGRSALNRITFAELVLRIGLSLAVPDVTGLHTRLSGLECEMCQMGLIMK
jgi:hypothetical protein